MVDLIYARASSSPGPGHYTSDITVNYQWGNKTMKNFSKPQKGSESKRSNVSNRVKVGTTFNKGINNESMESRLRGLNTLAIDSGLDHNSFEQSRKLNEMTKTSFHSQGSVFRSRSSSNPAPPRIIYDNYQDNRTLIIQPHYSQEQDNLIVSHNRQLIQRPITVSRNVFSPGGPIKGFSPGNSMSQDLYFKRSNTQSISYNNI